MGKLDTDGFFGAGFSNPNTPPRPKAASIGQVSDPQWWMKVDWRATPVFESLEELEQDYREYADKKNPNSPFRARARMARVPLNAEGLAEFYRTQRRLLLDASPK